MRVCFRVSVCVQVRLRLCLCVFVRMLFSCKCIHFHVRMYLKLCDVCRIIILQMPNTTSDDIIISIKVLHAFVSTCCMFLVCVCVYVCVCVDACMCICVWGGRVVVCVFVFVCL